MESLAYVEMCSRCMSAHGQLHTVQHVIGLGNYIQFASPSVLKTRLSDWHAKIQLVSSTSAAGGTQPVDD